MYLEVEGVARRGPVHVVHDLPYPVVESLFGINDGLWGGAGCGAPPGGLLLLHALELVLHVTGRVSVAARPILRSVLVLSGAFIL